VPDETIEQRLVHADPYLNCAHAHAATTADGTIVAVFNRAPRRRAILHPPEAPLSRTSSRARATAGDGGETFTHTVELATAPCAGGYGMRGAAELADGTLVLPLSAAPHYRRVFMVRTMAVAPGRRRRRPA
jgi:hypothetical protein